MDSEISQQLFEMVKTKFEETGLLNEIRCMLQSKIVTLMNNNDPHNSLIGQFHYNKRKQMQDTKLNDDATGNKSESGCSYEHEIINFGCSVNETDEDKSEATTANEAEEVIAAESAVEEEKDYGSYEAGRRLEVLNLLIMEYFHWHGFKYSADMFGRETGLKNEVPSRQFLEYALGSFNEKSIPLLLHVVSELMEESIEGGVDDESDSTDNEDETDVTDNTYSVYDEDETDATETLQEQMLPKEDNEPKQREINHVCTATMAEPININYDDFCRQLKYEFSTNRQENLDNIVKKVLKMSFKGAYQEECYVQFKEMLGVNYETLLKNLVESEEYQKLENSVYLREGIQKRTEVNTQGEMDGKARERIMGKIKGKELEKDDKDEDESETDIEEEESEKESEKDQDDEDYWYEDEEYDEVEEGCENVEEEKEEEEEEEEEEE